jgi:beta-glucanase (GH16 family)
MANIRFLLGFLPSTEAIESKRQALIDEYNQFLSYRQSDELKRYEELDAFVNSKEFEDIKKYIKSQKFKDTDEHKKLLRYIELKKSKIFKDYFKMRDSRELEEFQRTEKSGEVEKLEALEKFVNSADFEKKKSGLSAKEFKQSDEYQQYQQYKQLKKSPSLRKYYKIKSSEKFINYSEVIGSEKLTEYDELERFVNSEEFKEVKTYMALSPDKKFKRSEEFKRLQEYTELKKSDKIKWYYKVKDSNKFDELKNWEVTFEDDFDTNGLDKEKWLTRYFWAEKLLHAPYSLVHDMHFMTDGDNLSVQNSQLTITTRAEKVVGKAWDVEKGFFDKEFDYTSGIVNTGDSFRQQYGRFEAKIRFHGNGPVIQDFWLLGQQMVPHVDIGKYEKTFYVTANYWGNPNEKGGIKKKRSRFAASRVKNKFYIYTLEWTPEKLVWKINNNEVKTVTEGVPREPMYVILSAGLAKKPSNSFTSAAMDIDWVRISQKVEDQDK